MCSGDGHARELEAHECRAPVSKCRDTAQCTQVTVGSGVKDWFQGDGTALADGYTVNPNLWEGAVLYYRVSRHADYGDILLDGSLQTSEGLLQEESPRDEIWQIF